MGTTMNQAAILLPFGVGLPEILLILLLVGLFFGARKIPELGRGLGEGIRNFRKGLRSATEDPPPDKTIDKNSDPS